MCNIWCVGFWFLWSATTTIHSFWHL